ncbi:hypothetical protein, partial [Pseudomonas viridiflava]|uniref:hypothetical protein n=1 Tax=Pseudomonas viridiflava TaxID=33069 RepID=UPI00197E6970
DQQNYGVIFVQAVVSGVSHDGILFRSGEWLSFQRVARLMSIWALKKRLKKVYLSTLRRQSGRCLWMNMTV